jgi:hypothetical protein
LPGTDDIRQLDYFLDPRAERSQAPLLKSDTGEWSNAIDDYDFNARPSGKISPGGSYEFFDQASPAEYSWEIWLNDDFASDTSKAIRAFMLAGFDDLVTGELEKTAGLSIRCMSSENINVSPDDLTIASFPVHGEVVGLLPGKSVTLSLSRSDYTGPWTSAGSSSSSNYDSNGQKVFFAALDVGTNYGVSVSVQPAGQSCIVQNGSGSVPVNGIVTNVVINCN